MSRIEKAPARKPISAGTHLIIPISSDDAIAGFNSDQKLAAIMTPAVNPSAASSVFRLTSRKKDTNPAPIAVRPQVKVAAARACQTAGQDAKVSSIGTKADYTKAGGLHDRLIPAKRFWWRTTSSASYKAIRLVRPFGRELCVQERFHSARACKREHPIRLIAGGR